MSILWAITWILGIGFVTFIWLQIKAAGKAAEVVKRTEADNDALKKAAEPVTDSERERAARMYQRP